jgi:carbonic anhydrase/acetyltransferase-like protein (isoleucine patch superfamily)
MIGAGSVVSPSTIIPPGSLVLGIPGKVIRPLRPGEVERIAAQVDEIKVKVHQYRIGLKDF